MKNGLIQAILPLLRTKRFPASSKPQRILVVTTTALGDTLWATPALASLSSSFPNAYIGVLTSPIGMQILKHNPNINALYELKEPLSFHFFSLKKTLTLENFDTILIFHASQRLTLPLCSLLGAHTLAGTTGINKGLDSLLTLPILPSMEHEIVRRLNLVKAIGGKVVSETLQFFLKPEEKLPPRKERWIALHPGSKDPFKRWPAEQFISVAKTLQEKLSCQILITGSKEELPLTEKIAAAIPGANLSDPSLSLRQFAALLDQMSLLISNDTGPFHLACALETPAIGLYAATDPRLCGPHKAPHAIAISKPPSCFPCLKRKCGYPFCLLQIGAAEVVEAACKLWEKRK